MRKNKAITIIVLIFVMIVGLGAYAVNILQATNAKADNSIILGLDLSGGVSITYQIMTENPTETEISDTIAKLEERAENYSTEYAVYQVGEDRITVEIPGVFDANKVLEELGTPGTLYFIVEKNAEGKANYSYNLETENYVLNYELEELIANGSVILTGNDVKVANAVYQQDSYGAQIPVVQMTFTDEATEIFAEATKKAAEDMSSIGIYYNDHFISVPRVEEAISNGECIISGSGDYAEANELATFIRIGAISLKLEELESNVVGAQLGSQALTTSIKAAGIGLLLIMVFMIAFYRILGVVASIALAIYTFAVVVVIQQFEITLTLPGIAGIILGIGMAVDANVITFARIKEELGAGKTVSSSINEGYKKAMSAIVDGNITTFIASIVLMILGSGTVKGFAYTLMISIVLSMFTALIISKYLMKALFAIGFKDKKYYGRAKERKAIDFMKHKAIYFIISLAVVFAGFAGMVYFNATTGKSFNYGIEFAGGTSTTADFGKAYTIEQIEKDIVPYVSEITKDSAIQATTVDESTNIVLKTRTLTLEEREALNTLLIEQFGVKEETISSQSISSTISGEMRKDAIIAVIVACFFMLVYIRFRFKDIRFAVSAIIALVHDVLVVLTAYVLLRISVGNTLIACVLTIVGYSINDTIVIFDRIRENMNGMENQTPEKLYEIANQSLTQTLSRSINTSITTFIMVLLLFILGVPAIREFSLPLMVGLVCGSYSSIFIATELWYVMKVKFKEKEQEKA
ncbi:MAG: protein translocase subunit SecD [Lachnospiraceae bacterium]|nr:protein translocase subunit SecD [Lachnospiraceae bacterium]